MVIVVPHLLDDMFIFFVNIIGIKSYRSVVRHCPLHHYIVTAILHLQRLKLSMAILRTIAITLRSNCWSDTEIGLEMAVLWVGPVA
jgi:hypothetical protein